MEKETLKIEKKTTWQKIITIIKYYCKRKKGQIIIAVKVQG